MGGRGHGSHETRLTPGLAKQGARTGRDASPAPSDLRRSRPRDLSAARLDALPPSTLRRVSSPFGFLLSAEEPSRRTGVIVAAGAVALCTLIIYPLKRIAPVVSLGVVYLLAVLVVSLIWGAWLGFATAVCSAAAFNFFHLPPVGQFTIQSSSNWVALIAFLVAATLAGSVAEVTRARAR
jgi:Domain of unknown function (DUF4118)